MNRRYEHRPGLVGPASIDVQMQNSREKQPEQIKENHQRIRESDCRPIAWAERQPNEIELSKTEAVLYDHGGDHSHFLIQLATLRAENERLKKIEQQERGYLGSPCLCECDHKALRGELAKTAGARMQGEFLRAHSECRRSWCDDERHTWPPKRWTAEAAKQEGLADESEPRKNPGHE
jgi:hypothetical protein